jgi:hypothetical protein
MSHSVTIKRNCSQRTNDKIIRNHIVFLTSRALTGKHGRNWSAKASRPTVEKAESGWDFTSTIKFDRTSGRQNETIEQKQWLEILERLATSGQHTKFNKYPWQVLTGKESTPDHPAVPPSVVKPNPKDVRDYFDKIGIDRANHFERFYDRDHQIKRIHSAIVAAKDSNFNNRFNVVLHGPPGCGKTDLMRAVGQMLGEENEAFMHMDATSTTAAGVAKILLESDYIPPVLFVEEIEKAEVSSLPWLLGVADIRAEIRRTNFRVGNMAKNVKMLVIASVNDMRLFRNIMSGALASRFPTDVYCPRPNRIILQKILEREVRKNNGKMQWVEPTLQYCYDTKKWDDPRKLIPVCLCGKDDLLNGSFQQSLEATQTPENEG